LRNNDEGEDGPIYKGRVDDQDAGQDPTYDSDDKTHNDQIEGRQNVSQEKQTASDQYFAHCKGRRKNDFLHVKDKDITFPERDTEQEEEKGVQFASPIDVEHGEETLF
jgi:hypothetical protein